jgi:O-antigen ligase
MLKNIIKLAIILFSSVAVAATVSIFFKLSLLIIPSAIVGAGLVFAIFKNPAFGVFVVVFLLPFERIASFDLANITVRPSQIFAIIVIAAYLLRFLVKKESFNAKSPLLFPIFLFWGISIFSMANSQNLSRSLFVFAFTAFVMLIALFLPNLIKKEKDFSKTIWIILFTSGLISLFGFYQFAGDIIGLPPELTGLRDLYTKSVFGFPRVQSTFLEPLYFANFLLIPIGLCFSFLLSKLKQKSSFIKTFSLIFILTIAMTNLILTLSRGAYLAFAFLLLLTFLIYFKSFLSIKKIAVFLIIGMVAALSAYQFLKFTGKEKNIKIFLEHAAAFSAEKSVAVKERYTTMNTAWQMIGEKPIFGHGPGSFGPYAAASTYIMPQDGWAIVNNLFLEIWAEQGILGLLSFLILIAVLILRTIKASHLANKKNETYLKAALLGLFISFLAILAQYQTFSILYILHFWFLIGLILACQNLIFEKSYA